MFAIRTIILWQWRIGDSQSCTNGAEVVLPYHLWIPASDESHRRSAKSPMHTVDLNKDCGFPAGRSSGYIIRSNPCRADTVSTHRETPQRVWTHRQRA